MSLREMFERLFEVNSIGKAIDWFLWVPWWMELFFTGAFIGLTYIVMLIFKNVILQE